MSVEEFVDNTTGHLHGHRSPISEFSSWSASPRFVFRYATQKRTSAHIAVIDTQGLQADGKNVMFHVPALQPIFGIPAARRHSSYNQYNWEYLVHGVVEGKHYRAVSFQSLCSNGLTTHQPVLNGVVPAWGAGKFNLPESIAPITSQELQELAKIAKLFEAESEMCAGLLIALLCCKKRTEMGTGLEKNELDELVQYLGGRNNIPYDSCNSLLLHGGIYDPRYQDNEQMVNVMRALSSHCWGKGARARLLTSVADSNVDTLAEALSSVQIDSSEEPVASQYTNSCFRSGGHGGQK